MVAVSRGDILITSTPEGRRGFFYREMTGLGAKSARWFRHTGPVSDCLPRVDQETIQEEMEAGDRYFRRNGSVSSSKPASTPWTNSPSTKSSNTKSRPTSGSNSPQQPAWCGPPARATELLRPPHTSGFAIIFFRSVQSSYPRFLCAGADSAPFA